MQNWKEPRFPWTLQPKRNFQQWHVLQDVDNETHYNEQRQPMEMWKEKMISALWFWKKKFLNSLEMVSFLLSFCCKRNRPRKRIKWIDDKYRKDRIFKPKHFSLIRYSANVLSNAVYIHTISRTIHRSKSCVTQYETFVSVFVFARYSRSIWFENCDWSAFQLSFESQNSFHVTPFVCRCTSNRSIAHQSVSKWIYLSFEQRGRILSFHSNERREMKDWERIIVQFLYEIHAQMNNNLYFYRMLTISRNFFFYSN